MNIFIHATETYRVTQVMKNYGRSETEAHADIVHSDSARAAYYSKISGRKWGDAKQYDLCIDSSIGVQKAANVILEYVKGIGT
jgi:cytidylate kinase